MAIAALLLLIGVAIALKTDPDLPQPPYGAQFMIRRLPMSGNARALSELAITGHVVSLKRGNSKSLSSIYVQTMRKQSTAALEGDSRLTVSHLRRDERLVLTYMDI
jgi:hypothetical protein